MRLFFLLFVFLPITLCAENHAADTELRYPVLLSRPDRIGERFRLDAVVERHIISHVVQGAQAPEEKRINLRTVFSAEVTVRSINTRQFADALDLTLVSMTSHDATIPAPMTILAPGARISAHASKGKTLFTMDGSPLTETQSQELALFVSVDAGQEREKDVFGSAVPRKVGESWQVDRIAASRLLQMIGQIDPSAIRSESKLDSVFQKEGETFLSVTSRLTADTIAPEKGKPRWDSCKLLFTSGVLQPFSPASKRPRTESAFMRISMTYRIPEKNGSFTIAHQITEMRQTATITPQ